MDNYYAHEEGIQTPEASGGLYLQYINIRRFGSGFRPEEPLTSRPPYSGHKRHGQARPPAAMAKETTPNRMFTPGPRGAPNGNKRPRRPHATRRQAKPYGLVYQKLFADPGVYYRLPLGSFFVEARDQMRAPELLERDGLIDGLIQIYRIYRPIALKQLARVELGDPDKASSLHVLTPQKAHILGLTLGGFTNPDAQKPAQILRPGNHFFRLSLMSDPSVKVDKTKNRTHSAIDDFDGANDFTKQENHP